MSDAYVAGGAMIRMGRHETSAQPGLALPSVRQAVLDAGVGWGEIDAVICGSSLGGTMVAQRVCKELGIGGVPMTTVENACSSGATAVHQATALVRSGAADVVLAMGVDKLSALGGGPLPMSRAEDPDVQLGILMPAVYAMRAQRFLHERDATREDLASVSVQARAHGARNPYAQFRTPVTVEEVLASRPVADPLTLLQCCANGDGSAAVVVVSEKVRRRLATVTMKVAGSVLHSGTYDPGARPMLFPKITADSAHDAYEQASIGPEDIDLVELHDAFTISQLLYYEALQLCPRGEAVSFQRKGQATYGGSVVVSPSGGLLSRGHPIGATGVAQVVEALWHLRGQAGDRQVEGARHALTHVTGGGISGFDHGACTVHIFERAEAWAA